MVNRSLGVYIKSVAEKLAEKGNDATREMGVDVKFSTHEPTTARMSSNPDVYRGFRSLCAEMPRDSEPLSREFCKHVGIPYGII